jgi:hypothetical protein
MTELNDLAPLVTMTEEQYRIAMEGYGKTADGLPSENMLHDALVELDAQRRLRLAERRQAFKEAIQIVAERADYNRQIGNRLFAHPNERGRSEMGFCRIYAEREICCRDLIVRLEAARDEPTDA